jgi:hypothetical protein
MTSRITLVLWLTLAICTVSQQASLSAGLLGVRPEVPLITFLPVSATAYDSATGVLTLTADPVQIDLGSTLGERDIEGPRSMTIRVVVDQTGAVTGPFSETDLLITGSIDSDPTTPGADFSGVLLKGRIARFGWLDLTSHNDLTTDFFDFRFVPTGGALVAAGFFDGKHIGVAAYSEGSSFSGSFTRSFRGNAKGDGGAIPACGGSIGDFLWDDRDRDGVQDPGEPGLNGIVVRLTTASGVPLATATSQVGPAGQDGYYEFKHLCAGSYGVQVDPDSIPAGYTRSPMGAGTSATDSNPDPALVTLTDDHSQDPTVDFGFHRPCGGRIGNFVWNDINRDGVQDPGENGITGVRLTLRNIATNAVETTSTAFGGMYSFGSLCAGTYAVEVDTASAALTGFMASPVGTTTSDKDSDPNPRIVMIEDFTRDESVDFGFNLPCAGEIGDFVWFDHDRDGMQDAGEVGLDGVTVKLLHASGTEVAADITGPNGYYSFQGRCAGSYRVVVQTDGVLAGLVPAPVNTGSNANLDSNQNPASVVLTHDSGKDVSIDFGFMARCDGRIGDFVWLDTNANGIQDAGEPGLDGVRVNLLDSTNTLVATAITTTSSGKPGAYLFEGRCAGTYRVALDTSTLPPGVLASPTLQGNDRSLDSNPNPTTVLLPDGHTEIRTIDFGFFARGCSLCEGKVTELDVRYTGPVANPTIEVTSKQSGKGVGVVVTSLGGNVYRFTAAAGDTNSGFAGTLGTDITIVVKNGQTIAHTVSIHTSCSQPIGPGLVRGDFIVVRGQSKVGGELCPLTPPPPAPLTLSCPASTAQQNAHYSSSLVATGGVAPYTFSLTTGALPGGLALDTSTGLIAGTPNGAGTFNFAAKVTDSRSGAARTTTASCSIVVSASPSSSGLVAGDTATIGFWQNKNGQSLIRAMPQSVGSWLAANFPHLFGPLRTKTNAQVADAFKALFSVAGQKTHAQIMGSALAVYVTSSSVSGTTVARQYGFNVSTAGTGVKVHNVGDHGSAINLQNNTWHTVMKLLKDADAAMPIDSAEFNALNIIFDGINRLGDRQ